MTSNVIIPEDIKQIIDDILANKDKEKRQEEEEGTDLERLYIDEYPPEMPEEEEPIEERWKINYSFILQKLVKLANHLDNEGLIDEANKIDEIIKDGTNYRLR